MGSIRFSFHHGYAFSLTLLALSLFPAQLHERGQDTLDSMCLSPSPQARVAGLLETRYAWFSLEDIESLSSVIVAEAEAAGLAPELVAAVIDVESSGRQFAVSHVGAMGLMQLLPNTAESVANRAGVSWQGPETLFDPVSNVRLGVNYLDELVDRFGDIEVALTAYNWGPTRIARVLRNGGDIPVGYSSRVLRVYGTLI